MRTVCKVMVVLALAAFVVSPAFAQQGKKKHRGNRHKRTPITMLTNQLKKVTDLTDTQEKKIKEIIEKAKEDILELAAKAKIAPEQRKAMAAARKKAKADGLKGLAARKTVLEAAKMSPEQKEAYLKLQKAIQKLRTEVAAVLTPEQRKAAKIGGHRGKKGGRKKKNG